MHSLSSRPVKLDHGVGRWGHALKNSRLTQSKHSGDQQQIHSHSSGGGTERGREIVADGSAQNLL